MFELVLLALAAGAVFGTVAGYLHSAFITKSIAKGTAEYAKVLAEAKAEYAAAVADLKALKAKL